MLISLIRTFILYIFIIFCMRFMGKRQIGQLQPNELAITILISNMATLPIENTDMPLLWGIIPIFCLICLEFIFSFLTMKSKRLRNLISGKAVLIIKNGKLNQKAMKALRFSIDDLTACLHSCNVFKIDSVAYAMVETNGTMSVIKKFKDQNTTAQMMNLPQQETTIQLVVVSDGKIIAKNLQELNLPKQWLLNFIASKKLELNQIFIMTADKNKETFIALKEK